MKIRATNDEQDNQVEDDNWWRPPKCACCGKVRSLSDPGGWPDVGIWYQDPKTDLWLCPDCNLSDEVANYIRIMSCVLGQRAA
jgi:hypothetical protein